jgi:primosomal protein N' (replication factor Y) (superfamily II helicase)
MRRRRSGHDTLFASESRTDPARAASESISGGVSDRANDGSVFVRVVVERGIDQGHAAKGLTYRVGSAAAGSDDPRRAGETAEPIRVGDRVRVPLGKGDTSSGGIVTAVGGAELLDGFDARRVKAVLEHTPSRLPTSLLRLAEWMSDYYVCPLGVTLASMTPAAVKHQTGRRTRTLYVPAIDGNLANSPGDPGEPVPTGVDRRTSADAGSAPAPAARPMKPSARAALDALLALPSHRFPASDRDLQRALGSPTLAPINQLIRAGLLLPVERSEVHASAAYWSRETSGRDPTESTPDSARLAERPTLTDDQTRAVDGIAPSLGSFSTHLLHGVTGSGKTEVYMRLIERVLESRRTAIVLLPEIALTPQAVDRFEARFARVGVAVLHSGLSASLRHQQWDRAARGDAPIIVGARSAIFAPVSNLGLIVVDEEHETSYKQEQAPRYHARDVAVMRARLEGCPVVLGSATPSMESWNNAAIGKSSLWRLPNRVGSSRLPDVEVVDLAQENRARALARSQARAAGDEPSTGSRELRALGPTLESAIGDTLADDGQVILLLNRRGFANYLCCSDRTCGWMLGCDHCDASMVVHRDSRLTDGVLVCHHCLSEQRPPRRCPACGKPTVPLGVGTQRVEEELARAFGESHGLVSGASMLRVDSDTMRSGRDYFETLRRFGTGEIRLMLGTQMIAKGLDFPNVRLVGVINADTSLSQPDFRSWERTFQLVSQVAGRAGRGDRPGRVVVQTASPNNPAILLAARHEYERFAADELEVRRAAGKPPFARSARVVTRHADDAKAESSARAIADSARTFINDARDGDPAAHIEIVGPMPCLMPRIAGEFRFCVEFSSPTSAALQRVLAGLRSAGVFDGPVPIAVDVDPISFL